MVLLQHFYSEALSTLYAVISVSKTIDSKLKQSPVAGRS